MANRAAELRTGIWRNWGPMPAISWIVVLAYAATLFFFFLGHRPLTDHEVLVAGIARQMIESGSWGVPRIGDQLWLEKPPLAQWGAALAFGLFGTYSELAARVPSALAGAALVITTAGLGASMYGPRAGLLSGLICASCFGVLRYSRLAEVDIHLALLVTGSLAAFYAVFERADRPARHSRFPALLFWLLGGATNLAKGPLFGAALASAAMLAALVGSRRWRTLLRLVSPGGIVVGVAIALAWPVYVIYVGLGEELAAIWQVHILERATGAGNQSWYGNPGWYYLPAIAIHLFPWTPLAMVGLYLTIRTALRHRSARDIFLASWAIAPVVLLSLAAGKYHHYALPVLPAYAILGAIALERLLAYYDSGPRRVLRLIGTGAVAVGVLAAFGGAALSGLAGEQASAALMISLAAGAGSAAAGVLLLARRSSASAGAVFLALVVIASPMRVPTFAQIDPSAHDRQFLQAVADHLSPDETVIALSEQASPLARFIFYLRAPVVAVWNVRDIPGKVSGGKPFHVVARARFEAQLRQYGRLERVDQSRHTNHETGPSDRFSLYRVAPRAKNAGAS